MALKTINDLTALTTPASTDLVGVWAVGAARMRKSTIDQVVSNSSVAVLLAGRGGGQTIYGDTAPDGTLTLHGTIDNTRASSVVALQPIAGKVGVGTSAPVQLFSISSGSASGTLLGLYNTTNNADNRNWEIGLNANGYGMFSINSGSTQDGNPDRIRLAIDKDGNVGLGISTPSTKLDIDAGAISFAEMTAPAAGAANTGRLFCRDNGSGKSQLCVIFATGAIQVLATEP